MHRDGGVKLLLEFLNAVKVFAFHVARGQVEDQRRRGKGIRIEAEVTLAQPLDRDPALAAFALRQRMQQISWFRIVDTTQQREVVTGLQQAEVILDPRRRSLLRG